MEGFEHPPAALVLGCNTPHGVNVLSDWLEEQTGYSLDVLLSSSGWSAGCVGSVGESGNGYGECGRGDGFGGGGTDGTGHGTDHGYGNGFGTGAGMWRYYGMIEGRPGDGTGSGYGFQNGNGESWGVTSRG